MALTGPNENALLVAKPNLADMLNYHGKKINLELQCHHIGTIESFNPSTQTASVSINYVKSFIKQNSVGNPSVVTKEYPILQEVPVVFPIGSGPLGAGLTFPVKPGTECLLAFNDRDYDNWFVGSSNSPPNTGRMHAYTDAIAIIGPRSLPKILANFDNDAVNLQNGTSSVKVKADEVLQTVGTAKTDFKATVWSLDLGPAMKVTFNANGKFSVTNAMGEFVAALIQTLQTATAGGFPLLADLTILNSFKS